MREDSSIRDDVIAELEFDPAVTAAGLAVSVNLGVVTLSGHIPSYREKHAAIHAAEGVRGVRAVACDIQVRLPNDRKRNDDEIAARAIAILNWSVHDVSHIKIRVDGGWITLSGEIPHRYQKQDAEQALRLLGGVTGVTNLLTISDTVKPELIQDQIQRALARNARLDGASIQITVSGSRVNLSGVVRDADERKLAEDAAWAVRGVTDVYDDIVIARP